MIIKMKLNGKDVKISPYTCETIGSRTVLYNEESKKIVVLNNSGTLIWNEIVATCEKGCNLTTKDITEKILRTFDVVDVEYQEIHDDVNMTISSLFDASLLKLVSTE